MHMLQVMGEPFPIAERVGHTLRDSRELN
jgi:hypothetical protein